MAAKHHDIPSYLCLDFVLAYMYRRKNIDTTLADLMKEFNCSRQTCLQYLKNIEERYWYNIKFSGDDDDDDDDNDDNNKNKDKNNGKAKVYRLRVCGDEEIKENFENYMKYFFKVHKLTL